MTLDDETFCYLGNSRITEAQAATKFFNRQVDYLAVHHSIVCGDRGSVSKQDLLWILPVANTPSVRTITIAYMEIQFSTE